MQGDSIANFPVPGLAVAGSGPSLSFGMVPQFSGKGSDFEDFKDQLQFYFEAHKIISSIGNIERRNINQIRRRWTSRMESANPNVCLDDNNSSFNLPKVPDESNPENEVPCMLWPDEWVEERCLPSPRLPADPLPSGRDVQPNIPQTDVAPAQGASSSQPRPHREHKTPKHFKDFLLTK